MLPATPGHLLPHLPENTQLHQGCLLQGHTSSSLPVPKGDKKGPEADFWQGHGVIGQEAMALN